MDVLEIGQAWDSELALLYALKILGQGGGNGVCVFVCMGRWREKENSSLVCVSFSL